MQKVAYGVRMSDWSSDVCSSDLGGVRPAQALGDEAFLRRRIVEAVVVEVVVEVLGEGAAAGLAVQLPVLGDHRHRTAPAAGLGGLEQRRQAATAIRTALGAMRRNEIAVTGQGANDRHCRYSAAPSGES